ncbi:unnamed protein product [Trichogramma brassicae]|uniref:Uncharacterized protein n=1 Tax=Trichogramma brassicae TaxID=86971 RepID=A0A6H5IJ94_9HYME|nr:unnamed protein product [Trichogramma brassicae]
MPPVSRTESVTAIVQKFAPPFSNVHDLLEVTCFISKVSLHHRTKSDDYSDKTASSSSDSEKTSGSASDSDSSSSSDNITMTGTSFSGAREVTARKRVQSQYDFSFSGMSLDLWYRNPSIINLLPIKITLLLNSGLQNTQYEYTLYLTTRQANSEADLQTVKTLEILNEEITRRATAYDVHHRNPAPNRTRSRETIIALLPPKRCSTLAPRSPSRPPHGCDVRVFQWIRRPPTSVDSNALTLARSCALCSIP